MFISFALISVAEVKKATNKLKLFTVLWCMIVGVTALCSLILAKLDILKVEDNAFITILLLVGLFFVYRWFSKKYPS